MVGDRCGCCQRVDVVGGGVDDPDELVHVRQVLQGLNAAGGGARADGDEELRLLPDELDSLGVVRCGDRTLDQRHGVGAVGVCARGLREVGDVDRSGDLEQLVFEIQQAELTAVARCELPNRK